MTFDVIISLLGLYIKESWLSVQTHTYTHTQVYSSRCLEHQCKITYKSNNRDRLECSTPPRGTSGSNRNYHVDTYFLTLNDFRHTVSEENKSQTVIFAKYVFTCIYLQKKMSKKKIQQNVYSSYPKMVRF